MKFFRRKDLSIEARREIGMLAFLHQGIYWL